MIPYEIASYRYTSHNTTVSVYGIFQDWDHINAYKADGFFIQTFTGEMFGDIHNPISEMPTYHEVLQMISTDQGVPCVPCGNTGKLEDGSKCNICNGTGSNKRKI